MTFQKKKRGEHRAKYEIIRSFNEEKFFTVNNFARACHVKAGKFE